MRKGLTATLIIAATLLSGQYIHAQGAGQTSGMTVESVLTMVKAGLSDDLIVAKLRQQNKAYDLSTDEMIQLKQAKVSDAVIRTMLDPKSMPAAAMGGTTTVIAPGLALTGSARPSGATPDAGTGQIGDPNDPLLPHDSGIYVMAHDRDGKAQMTVLERAAYQGSKTGGILASSLTYGIAKAKTKAQIPGPHATIRVTETSPVFYFYFDDKQAGLGKTYFGVNSLSNPNQFALLKLNVNKSSRETVIGKFSAWGSSTGTDTGEMVAFKSERIRAGLYKVSVDGLKDGEFCFYASSGAATTMTSADMFDFGVSLK